MNDVTRMNASYHSQLVALDNSCINQSALNMAISILTLPAHLHSSLKQRYGYEYRAGHLTDAPIG